MSRAKKTEADQKLMDEWLKSNEVTVCPAHARTEQEDIVYTFKIWSLIMCIIKLIPERIFKTKKI